MKTTLKNSITTIIILLVATVGLHAATYTSLTSGSWSNTTNVWSLDGITPCGCTPGPSSAGNDININHALTVPYDIDFHATSTINISSTGSMSGTFTLKVWNATMNSSGQINASKFGQAVAAVTNLNPGAIITLSSNIDINDGVFNNNGGLVNSGSLKIGAAGTLNLINASKMHVNTGNLTNHGFLSIGPDCCMSSNGNWKNSPTGTVTGTGSVNSGGNINNSGIWDVNIVWCSTGGDLGMPSPEDCINSDAICAAIVLPVELVDFATTLIEDDFAMITWSTLTEINNDYFILYKSSDGTEWEEIDRIDGAGNSTELLEYYSYDYNVQEGVTYYQLIQVDFDGKNHPSTIVSINKNVSSNEYSVYPNPTVNTSRLSVTNLSGVSGPISITNSSGRTVIQESFDETLNSTSIDISNLETGIYFVNVIQDGELKTQKLIVTN
ncbi:MAG: T9SS type A sorting domain-containing protein [Crocinitomicaceae bacterium]|nr:T9SS type A sorting domain-containing protein [Crocinitomicaceae bacterium]